MKMISALLLAVAAGPIWAAPFSTPIVNKSSVTFVSKQMGVSVTGGFSQFTSQISLDPAHPQIGKAQIEVAVASIDAGSSEANDEVKGKSWFNVKQFPVASFVSSDVKALGGNRYQATGKLTIKGVSHQVVVPFTANPLGFLLVLDGAIPISRAQYSLGEGAWSDPSVVADAVQIRFHFTLGAGK